MSRLDRAPREAVVDGFTHGGEGVVRIDGKAVFVAGALPGERIRLRVVEDRKRWARAELVAVLQPADDRVVAPCPYADVCGGCDLQHVSPHGQLALKTRVVREQLQRIGRIPDPVVHDCVGVGPAVGYRTQARMHADDAGRLGFHRRGTNEVVPIDTCMVLTPGAQSVRDHVGDRPGLVEVALHATSTGDRAAILTTTADELGFARSGTGTGDRAAATLAPADLPALDPDATDSDAHRRAPVTIGLRAPGQPPAPARWVRGSGVVREHVAGFDFDVRAGGFFQGNVPGAEALVEAVLDAIRGAVGGPVDDEPTPGRRPHVWDLYAGVGLFTLPVAATGARVTAVEVVADAVDHLQRNASRADLADHVEAVTDDVAAFVARPGLPRPDVVVVDPPRTGCGVEAMSALAELARSTIVYVACDPAALARDTRVATESGWDLVDVRPFDLFPMTHHVEAVATLRRRD